jgi:hypothetical protein
MKTKSKIDPTQLVRSHLTGIKRALLEGEKRPAFLEFLKQTDERRGLYALYNKKGRLYYAGKATDLRKRLDQHLKDKHADSWDQMTLFFLNDTSNVSELEGLLIATAKPPGNSQKPRIGTDLKKQLKRYLKQDAIAQIDQVIYPDKKVKKDSLLGRITPKKLKSISQNKLANTLGISQGRVSQLWNEDAKNLSSLRGYIKSAGKRDAVLLLFEKSKIK